MQWSTDLVLGIESIDSQHKNIIERIQRLEIALDSQATSVTYERMIEIYDFLGEYVVTHFRDEEEIMAEGGYPDLAVHKAMHRSFEEELAKLRDDLGHSGMMSHAAAQLVSYLSKWFTSHIQKEDPKYLPYVK